jgi:hypothetical protein
MKRLTIEDIHKKKQHISILDVLYKYTDGITLQELTYLLTLKKNMYNLSKLVTKFEEESRKDIFNSRQRVNDCCNDLKHLGLIKKSEKKYYFNYPGIKLLKQYLRNKHEINIWRIRNINLFKDFHKIIISPQEQISKEELIEIENEIKRDIKQGKLAPWHEYSDEKIDKEDRFD